ncbi:TPA: GBS Bsp-like repeat-containing protein [Streptococcus suis]
MKLFHFSEIAQRFSFRKYAIGVASVCLAFTFLGSSVVAAEEVVSTDVSPIVTGNGSPLQDSLSTEVSVESFESQLKEQVGVTPVEESTVDSYLIGEEKVAETPITESKNEATASLGDQDIEIKTDDIQISSSDLNKQDLKVEVDGVILPELEIKPEEDVVQEEIIEIPSNQINIENEPTNAISSIGDNKVEVPTLSIDKELESDVRTVSLEVALEGFSNLRSVRETRVASRSATSSGIIGDDYPASWKYQTETADPWGYNMSYCTSFAAHRLSRVNRFETPSGLGDAKYWASNARAYGYRVDNIPAPGAIAYDVSGIHGHVAWVANVSGDSVTVEEYNYGRRYVYNTRTVSRTAFTGYIHFKDLSSSQVGNPSGPEESGDLPASGVYRFASRLGVKNEPKISSPDIAFYEIGEVVNYDRTLKADNHQWISYISHSGNRRYIAVKQLAAPAKPVVSGNIHIQNKNEREGVFEVVVRDASSNVGLKEVQIPVWSTNGGQDDLIWYKATRQGNGDYKTTINIANHKNDRGEYHIHLYYVVDNGQQVGVGGTTTTISEQSAPVGAPTGTITIQNKDDNLGSFDIVIRDVSHPKGVKEVRVPVWSDNNGQDDIVWYVAARQEDGTYKVSVKATNHKNSQGQYLIHMYYVQSDDQLSFAGSATTVVKSTIRPSIPNSGSYTFSKRSGIKNEAKVNSPDIAFYEVGERVNYDKVLFSDGRYWISYISFSGNRRYITIT